MLVTKSPVRVELECFIIKLYLVCGKTPAMHEGAVGNPVSTLMTALTKGDGNYFTNL